MSKGKTGFTDLPVSEQVKIIKKKLRPKLFGVRIYYDCVRSNEEYTLIVWLFWIPVFVYSFIPNSASLKTINKNRLVCTSVYYWPDKDGGYKKGWHLF